MHLVVALKQRVKDAASEIEARDHEIAILKKNIKVTRLNEYEVRSFPSF
jgi:hypothetical protein